MSGWIKRSEQEPPKGVVVVHTDGENFWTVRDICHSAWTHWLSIPAPPPRTVTIEISEDDAKSFSRCFVERGPSLTFGETARLGEACRKALEAKR